MTFSMDNPPLNGPQGLGAGMQAAIAVKHVLQITEDKDGGVTITRPDEEQKAKPDGKHDENLAEWLAVKDASVLGTIADDLLTGIEADIQSRQEFIDNYVKGIDLLGLKIEESSNTKTQSKNVSRVRHPVLLEAIVRGQSLARAELLPSSGPVKAATAGGSTVTIDEAAKQLETDMNYYLTVTAREYYPDMDRGLFWGFYSGNLFKKVYNHPIKRRPVSDCVAVEDLIVSQDTTDLDDALRVTHRSMMLPSMIKRMQAVKAYRDVELSMPMPANDPAKVKEKQAQGIQATSSRPQDIEHTVYECYTDLDLEEFGIKEKGWDYPGIPLPYCVTIDKDTRTVLALRRNWKEGDNEFVKKQVFVHYGLVPAFGFLCLGQLHLLGNQTKALTAIWRLMCDAGMFGNFPGGIKARSMRSSTNEIRPGPGEWVDVDIGPFDKIQDAFMPMPYKDLSAVFMQFAEMISQDAQRMAGAIEMEVGEGRSNVPVGTVMAMIEQQTQVMSAVHKRLHTAQAREIEMLRECFAADPTALTRFNRNPARQAWTAEEIMNANIVPASDPNVPAQMHRMMQNTALMMVADQNPDLYDRRATHRRVWKSVGVNDIDSMMLPAPQPGAGIDPATAAMGAQAQAEQASAQAKMAATAATVQKTQIAAEDSRRKATTEAVEAQQQDRHKTLELANAAADRQSKEQIEQQRLDMQRNQQAQEDQRAAEKAQADQMRHTERMEQLEKQTQRGLNTGMALPGKKKPKGKKP